MLIKFVNLKKDYSRNKSLFFEAINEVGKDADFILGKSVSKFEKSVCEYLKIKHCVTVGNGTDALILALKCLGIKKGDEVIVPVNSFIASAAAVVACGATPIFVDICACLNLDILEVEKKITKKTKVIMTVPYAGRPISSMSYLKKIAKTNNIKIVEDAAQSFGASFEEKYAGTFGDIGCFSLHPLKNFNVFGDGGLIVTNNKNYYTKLLKLRNLGLKNRAEASIYGVNSRLDSIHAAYALKKIKYIKKFNLKMNNIGNLYNKKLSSFFIVPIVEKEIMHIYHRYIVICKKNRKDLMDFLYQKGIETKIHYPVLLSKMQCYKNIFKKKEKFRVAEYYSKRMLSLPLNIYMSRREMNYIFNSIKFYYSGKN